MSQIPKDLKYAKSHEWVRTEKDGTLTVGITDHAQELMGDMVYVDLPQAGAQIAAGKECAVVESVKAASDVYAPVSGEIVAANDALAGAPETVNKDPYGTGWMFRIKPANKAELDGLLDAKAYDALVASEKH
ncbi:MAG: glycine cleavage system protein H [Candidatus Muproteobacteria bacterium RIFCSPHIGHO2_01_FULL_65_16]|uniref:Glycine cleavage system H protein n=1 Tax=Candidatus Muproteobacteria bacterium RIFCSPHIGHO2_01_FULL_65_16 TaxID=1817764 RepID=A0A1F6TKP4_9PROT|nr:MAG: glycine cleavage system protein H [Candidatus Muproteobacteria bacterium RIFCSPHIGHO2_01_FULL_65_16]